MNGLIGDGQEVMVNQEEFMVTKTDLKGNLIYANRAFMQISGYPEYELLGKPHSIIRHPDMPHGIFRLLWETIESGRECFLYLKNLTRNGDFYWVFSNVSVDRDDKGSPKAYFSVRRRPSREGVEAIKPLYQEMRRIEQSAGSGDAAGASLRWLMHYVESKGHSYESFIHTLGY